MLLLFRNPARSSLYLSAHTSHQVDLVRALSRSSQQALKCLEKEWSTPKKNVPPLFSSQLYSSQMSGVSDTGLYDSSRTR